MPSVNYQNDSVPHPPVHAILEENPVIGTLYLKDNTALQGISFGAERSIAGECVFQTGMVGYPESLTDPSYRGQILVLTFPLVGNYGVPSRDEVEKELNNLPKYFESSKIHVAGLIIGQYSLDFSHYLAKSSLSDWLKENDVPALYGIDTRALTKKIRTQGVLLGKILFPKSVVGDNQKYVDPDAPNWLKELDDVEWHDPNTRNLVAEVSTKEVQYYKADPSIAIKGPDGKTIQILVIDVGMKNNQIRCFVKRGVDIKVVPWDYDFLKDNDYDAVFVSNGPGDPSSLKITIEHLRTQIKKENKPMFGICLGHQLISLAAGATTRKMKFGNRGHNIPCTDMKTGRCFITSQNHGYAVDANSLPDGWKEYFVNANDASNEGIYHETLPYFSVQFHPEATPGPKDTEFLFDEFINIVKECKTAGKLVSLPKKERVDTPKRVNIRKVLILGSGGLSIGQAGEFDYSGSQAIKAFKEEGIYTILINPNIATIQTSQGLADKIYFLPVTADFVRKVIRHEKPDGICCTFGGQTALNVGVKLKDEFEGLGVKVLGTPIETIEMTEDRELFAQALYEINEKCAKSEAASSLEEAIEAANRIQYPLIIRAAYTLGGLGSGFAENEEQLRDLCNKAFATSPQVLVERSMKGWKEVEYEVVRDSENNCITVCNMENFDPLGVHTGDSIVVAPSQTLTDEEYHMLRTAAIKIIRHLGVVGECNVQYALNPESLEYAVIEVNARLSRSSALASKATGYPLAFVAAKIALGHTLPELKNSVTKTTTACFEPSLDYIVTKIPRWDLSKFHNVSRDIGSCMKSVGEVMAIGRTFEESLQKAVRQVDPAFGGYEPIAMDDLDEVLMDPTDRRLFAVAEAMFNQNYSIDKIHDLTKIDKWFLYKLENIMEIQKELTKFKGPMNIEEKISIPEDVHIPPTVLTDYKLETSTIPVELLERAKKAGFSDDQIAKATSSTELAIRELRKHHNIIPFVKRIDTLAAEFPAATNYLYTTYNASTDDLTFEDHGIMVLGSGVYRIGSSVEFDWCGVSCSRALRDLGYKTIMINYNPETVSTDFDECDRLYFEELNFERVMDIYEKEQSRGIVVSVGGQLPQNIALKMWNRGVRILGTSPVNLDRAEDREKFSKAMDAIGIDQPAWRELKSTAEAHEFADSVGYPVLVRPSYVLSGAAMNVAYNKKDLDDYLSLASTISHEHPVVMSKFIQNAQEIDVDAVANNGELCVYAVSQHIENAGVHSGDASMVLPPEIVSEQEYNNAKHNKLGMKPLTERIVKDCRSLAVKVAKEFQISGPFNMQLIKRDLEEDGKYELKVIECNLRSSRSFPFVSKVLDTNFIDIATRVLVQHPSLKDLIPKEDPMLVKRPYKAIKVPVFSWTRLAGADPMLSVEMSSTGEVACFGRDVHEAYFTSTYSNHNNFKSLPIPANSGILIARDRLTDDKEFKYIAKKLVQQNYKVYVDTKESQDILAKEKIDSKIFIEGNLSEKLQDRRYCKQKFEDDNVQMVVSLARIRPGRLDDKDYLIRRVTVDLGVGIINDSKDAILFVEALEKYNKGEYKKQQATVDWEDWISKAKKN